VVKDHHPTALWGTRTTKVLRVNETFGRCASSLLLSRSGCKANPSTKVEKCANWFINRSRILVVGGRRWVRKGRPLLAMATMSDGGPRIRGQRTCTFSSWPLRPSPSAPPPSSSRASYPAWQTTSRSPWELPGTWSLSSRSRSP
jgi:hypothetical protein